MTKDRRKRRENDRGGRERKRERDIPGHIRTILAKRDASVMLNEEGLRSVVAGCSPWRIGRVLADGVDNKLCAEVCRKRRKERREVTRSCHREVRSKENDIEISHDIMKYLSW